MDKAAEAKKANDICMSVVVKAHYKIFLSLSMLLKGST